MAVNLATFQRSLRLLAIEGAGHRQDAIALFDQVQLDPFIGEIGEFAGQFHPGGSASHNHQGRAAA